MIDKIDISQPRFESGASPVPPKPSMAIPTQDADVSIQVNYASLIDKAMQAPQDDAQRVQQARELFLSGQLETPENIREAAENIVKYGI